MPDANMYIDRRQYPRVQTSIPVRYRLIDDQKEIASLLDRKKRDQKSSTVDLSEGGVYITTVQLVPLNSILRLDILLPETEASISAFAEAVWSNETGCGLRFLAIKDEDAGRIKEYINRNAS